MVGSLPILMVAIHAAGFDFGVGGSVEHTTTTSLRGGGGGGGGEVFVAAQ